LSLISDWTALAEIEFTGSRRAWRECRRFEMAASSRTRCRPVPIRRFANRENLGMAKNMQQFSLKFLMLAIATIAVEIATWTYLPWPIPLVVQEIVAVVLLYFVLSFVVAQKAR
jgi:hypothetical protein